MIDKPRYFVAVFGDPQPDKDAVDSGVYTPDPRYAPFSAKPGDIVLLYCTAGYAAYPMQVPGLGIVLRVNSNSIEYRWMPFAQPIPKAVLGEGFERDDVRKFRDIRFSARWLFEISKQSFSNSVAERLIAWKTL